MKDWIVLREDFAANTWRVLGGAVEPTPERAIRALIAKEPNVMGQFAVIEKERFSEFVESEGSLYRVLATVQAIEKQAA